MTHRLKFYGWGFENTGLSEAEREHLFRFVADRLGVEPRLAPPPQASEIALRAPRVALPAALAGVLTADLYERLLHTYGKSFPETIRAFARDFANAPDLVALPAGEADVAAVLDWASDANIAVIPFGCGSSVVGGVEPAVSGAYAGAVSLDMRRLDRVLEVDATSRAARIESGIRGPAIEAALKPHGFAIRHYPQSFEFSTLGGWIATRSGGHFATLYTHIDDFVESLRTITPAGAMESRRLPGSGAGPSPDRMIIGSEGALGVITEAWMRLQGRPRFRGDAVFGFPDFFAAARAVRAVAQAGLYPSNLRIIDNDEAGAYGVSAYEESLLVLAFESADHPVEAWMARAIELVEDNGGRRHADEGAGSRWRTAFIRMPYARELTAPMGVINDTFESAITWDRFEAFHGAVRKATAEALQEATGNRGTVSTRFTHVYPDGPAVYYTFNVRGAPGRLIEQWRHIKTRASDALIAAGGTITHHHAVGRDHMAWYRAQRPALFGKALAAAKSALDPAGILTPASLSHDEGEPTEHPALRMSNASRLVVVWDAPIRLFHWLVAALVAAAYATWRLNWMDWHGRVGDVLLALLLFRLLWGFFGSETARFSRFLTSPRMAVQHLKYALVREPDREVGHNPAGGWMVLFLLALLLAETLTGLYVANDIADVGPLTQIVPAPVANAIDASHAIGWDVLLAAIALHVLAIFGYAAAKGQNLVRPMITGLKALPASVAAPRIASPARAAFLFAASAVAAALLANLM